jgi:hypothetical protein
MNMLLLSFVFHLLFHPFYVSVTTIETSRDNQSVEIISRIFYDDLEEALKGNSNSKVDLRDISQEARNNTLIKAYFSDHFKIILNGKPAQPEFIGYSIENEAAWCFFEIKNSEKVLSIDIISRILYKSFENQTNIFHLRINNQKKSLKLQNPQTVAKFKFTD